MERTLWACARARPAAGALTRQGPLAFFFRPGEIRHDAIVKWRQSPHQKMKKEFSVRFFFRLVIFLPLTVHFEVYFVYSLSLFL